MAFNRLNSKCADVHQITIDDLTVRFGGGKRFWTRYRPAMVQSRLLVRVGKSFFGDLAEIELSLSSGTFPHPMKKQRSPLQREAPKGDVDVGDAPKE